MCGEGAEYHRQRHCCIEEAALCCFQDSGETDDQLHEHGENDSQGRSQQDFEWGQGCAWGSEQFDELIDLVQHRQAQAEKK